MVIEIPNGSLSGVCCVCSDTGLWAFQNTASEKIITIEKNMGVTKTSLLKKGSLHVIKNGDWLAVLHPTYKERVVWHGTVVFAHYTKRTPDTTRGILAIRAFPFGVSEAEWRAYFIEGFMAKFLPGR